MSGYSPTPLLQKLGIRPGHRVGVWGELPATVPVVAAADGPFDVLLVFLRWQAEIDAVAWGAAIRREGAIWACWPKKAARARVPSDLSEDLLRAAALPLGLVDNKVCAVDDDWSGLRLVWRVHLR